MERSTSKWLTGCGIGCLAVIILVVAIGTGAFMYVKSKVQGFKEGEAAFAEVERRHGKLQDYCPDADGRIRDSTLEAFLKTRESMAPVRRNLESALAGLAEKTRGTAEKHSFIGGVRILGDVFGFVSSLAAFQSEKARALLNADLGAGEYAYVYVVAYYSWLGKSPGDGPDLRLRDEGPVQAEAADPGELKAERREQVAGWVHHVCLPMLRRQLASLEEQGATPKMNGWHTALSREIAALEADRHRVPWQDGVPGIMQECLQPVRARLEASYSPLANPIETGRFSEFRKDN